jgi:thiol-disulfide isomerase/thioredoxin
LFTNKKGIPLIYKALSYNFEETLFFGLVREAETAIAKKYKVNDFPTILLFKTGDAKPKKFEGKLEYMEIFNFINIYSEVFDFGEAKESSTVSAAAKPWMSEPLPELHYKSSDDLCFKKEAVCVIFITHTTPDEGIITGLKEVAQGFSSQLDNRGVHFSFMWVNSQE